MIAAIRAGLQARAGCTVAGVHPLLAPCLMLMCGNQNCSALTSDAVCSMQDPSFPTAGCAAESHLRVPAAMDAGSPDEVVVRNHLRQQPACDLQHSARDVGHHMRLAWHWRTRESWPWHQSTLQSGLQRFPGVDIQCWVS